MNQNGAVAMISVVIFAMIITILVTAYARTIVSQQRQATSYDLSTRAFYAAEAGVQDAIRAIAINPTDEDSLAKNGQDTCKNGSVYLPNGDGSLGSSAGNLAYTCQLVSVEPDELTGVTTENTGLWQVKPGTDESNYTLSISWSKAQDDSFAARSSDSKLFPPTDKWFNGENRVHPLLRVSFISTPTSNVIRTNMQQSVFFLNPTTDGEGATGLMLGNQDEEDIVRNVACVTTAEYSCKQDFTFSSDSLSDKNLYVVIHSEYGNAAYSMTMANPVGGRVGFAETAATIDVTAKAGDVFRRIKQTVPLKLGYQESWFDASGLVVADGICKLFSIGELTTQFNRECIP